MRPVSVGSVCACTGILIETAAGGAHLCGLVGSARQVPRCTVAAKGRRSGASGQALRQGCGCGCTLPMMRGAGRLGDGVCAEGSLVWGGGGCDACKASAWVGLVVWSEHAKKMPDGRSLAGAPYLEWEHMNDVVVTVVVWFDRLGGCGQQGTVVGGADARMEEWVWVWVGAVAG